jgi:gamma-glutamyltranspeptidase/glutathione hydrolase
MHDFSPAEPRWDLPYASQRMPTFARRGMVATSQVLAAQAGVEILARGGSAADAAVATAACMTVLEPTTNGIGGDAFALVWNAGALHGLNGSGRSPAALDRTRYAGRTMPTRGWDAVTVPGQVALWTDLHARFGRLSFAQLMEPAAAFARDGYPVAVQTARLWDRAAAALASDPEWRRTFTIDGRAPRAGEVIRLLDHARTLEAIGESAGADFYRGDLAARIAEFAKSGGGTLAAPDLASHATESVTPISHGFRGARLHEIPPNGQGIAALIALAILERTDIDRHPVDSPEAAHLAIEAIKLAFREAHLNVAEPAAMRTTPEAMLDPAAIDRLAARIDAARAQDFDAGVPKPGGTIYLSTADDAGMMVSLIQSNYMGFGSGLVVPGTGIALQNRGACFTLEPGHPNELAPGKRPYHTIIPGFLGHDTGVRAANADGSVPVDRPIGPFGIMGGFMQPQAHVQYVLRTVLHGQNPQAALDAPRWQWMKACELQLEPGWPAATIDGLRARGHQVTVAGEKSVTFGRGQAIMKMDGAWCGASDLRGDGCAAGR